jgi:hypothetical protein
MSSAAPDEWANLADDLRRGAPKRAAIFALVSTTLFVVGAAGLHHAWLPPGGSSLGGRVLGVIVLFVVFAIFGAIAGAILGTTTTIRRALPAFERGLHRSVGPLMGRAVDRVLGGERTISVERLRALLDGEIQRVSDEPAGMSPARLLARFVIRSSLRLVRAVMMREFLARLEERGASHVTAVAVEAFVREKLVRLVVARVETQVGAAHWGVAAVSAVAVLGPYLYLLLVG